MTQTLAPAHLFDSKQWQQLQPIITSLDKHQALWLSGYLASNAYAAGAIQPGLVAQNEDAKPILIAFGTETDNCRGLAQSLVAMCSDAGITAETADLSSVRMRKLTKTETLIVITATHGDGDPPEPIEDFYEAMMAEDAPTLKKLKFAVLALGDSSYEHFCATGVAFDERLEALGAERLIARQDCDLDFEKPAAGWMAQLLDVLRSTVKITSNEATIINGSVGGDLATSMLASPDAAEYSKKNPITVEVMTNQNLSHAKRAAPIHHLELALNHDDFVVEAGDAVGVLVDNPPELVALILDATGLSGEQPVSQEDKALPLVEVLRENCDLTIPGKAFLEMWATISGSETLKSLVSGDNLAQRRFLRDHQIRDLVIQYPARPEPQALVDALRPLQPRLYDVANSLAEVDDELHLTVKAFSYPFCNRQESGIAARFLLDLAPGDNIRLYPHRNARFRLPESSEAPIILIAEGTGIAPYRAFLQSLALKDDAPPCWLIFSEKHFEDDFLYQLDVQKAFKEGVLSHVDAVFTGDNPCASLSGTLLGQSARLIEWLEKQAHIYFCGEKLSLESCEALVKDHVDMSLGDGHWKQMNKEKRIHRNLY